jgi:hypothetical protein
MGLYICPPHPASSHHLAAYIRSLFALAIPVRSGPPVKMFLTVFLAVIAAIPVATAQNNTSTTTKCTTSWGMQPLSTGTVETFYAWPFPTTTNVINVTSTSCSTVMATRSASTVMQFITSTVTVSSFETVTPEPQTIPTPAGFLPLLAYNPAGPTATGTISRFKRHELEGQDAHLALQILRRQEQTPANSTTGFIVDRNGNAMSLQRKYPRQVNCRVNVNVNMTMTTVVEGPTETMWATGGIVPTAMNTLTTTTTTVLTAVAPRRTIYAACQPNNIGKSYHLEALIRHVLNNHSELDQRHLRQRARLRPRHLPPHSRLPHVQRTHHQHLVRRELLHCLSANRKLTSLSPFFHLLRRSPIALLRRLLLGPVKLRLPPAPYPAPSSRPIRNLPNALWTPGDRYHQRYII